MFGAARVQAPEDLSGARIREHRGAGKDIIDALATGSVGGERLAPVVENVSPRIAQTAGEDFQLHRLGPELPDAAAVEAAHAVGRLDVAVDVDRLVEVQHSVVAPTKRVQNVVRVLGAEARQHDAADVGLAVAVGVLEVQQFGAVGHVDAAVARLDAGGNQQTVGKDGGLLGAAVAVGVVEHQNLIVRFLARLDLRINLAAGDPQPALSVEIDVDRLGQQRIGGVQVDLEAVGDLKRLAFQLRIGIGDDFQVALRQA